MVESDESDGSFLRLAPILAVVTNIDREHLDHYASLDVIREAFTEFINKVPFYGAAIVCIDDENVQSILPGVRRRTVTYGRSAQADMIVHDSSCGDFHSCFEIRHHEEEMGEFKLNVPGEHNVLNATAAIAIALEMHVDVEQIREGLALFAGVDRRFQVKGKVHGSA